MYESSNGMWMSPMMVVVVLVVVAVALYWVLSVNGQSGLTPSSGSGRGCGKEDEDCGRKSESCSRCGRPPHDGDCGDRQTSQEYGGERRRSRRPHYSEGDAAY